MGQKLPWRVRILAWGNLAIGLAAPLSILFNILAALKVFSLSWAAESMVLASVLGLGLGALHASSGWAIRNADPRAWGRTCCAAGFTLGYAFIGVLTMATSGRDRALEIVIRHGSENWWDWSLSQFQNSSLRELPLMIWWIFGLGTILRFRLPGASERLRDRLLEALPLAFALSLFGGLMRVIQFALDTGLASNR